MSLPLNINDLLHGKPVEVVWFPKEGPGGNKFSEKIFKGPIPRMTRDALDYIKRNLISETVIKHHGRAESTRVENFPYDAIEEAVVNAVYHRGYDVREPVEIRIMHDELVVLSYPGPDRSVRLDQLRIGRAHPRRYRNRRIGEFLKELEFTEGRSTGIPKIMEAMAKNGSPPAEFEFDEDHSYFMARLPVHPAALEVTTSTAHVEKNLDTPLIESRSESGLESRLESRLESALAVKIFLLLSRAEMGKAALAIDLGHKTVSGELHKQIKRLLALNLIEMTIPDKPNSRLQKYRLTDNGLSLLASLQEDRS